MKKELWNVPCYVVCFDNANGEQDEQYCKDILMMISALRYSISKHAALDKKAGKMPSMECLNFIKYLDSLRSQSDTLDSYNNVLFCEINDKLAVLKDEFKEGVYSIQEREVCSIADRFYTKHHK